MLLFNFSDDKKDDDNDDGDDDDDDDDDGADAFANSTTTPLGVLKAWIKASINTSCKAELLSISFVRTPLTLKLMSTFTLDTRLKSGLSGTTLTL